VKKKKNYKPKRKKNKVIEAELLLGDIKEILFRLSNGKNF